MPHGCALWLRISHDLRGLGVRREVASLRTWPWVIKAGDALQQRLSSSGQMVDRFIVIAGFAPIAMFVVCEALNRATEFV